MLSQQRGPSAALKYARERERLLKKGVSIEKLDAASEGDKEGTDAAAKDDDGAQKVVVLQGGFEEWVRRYVHSITLCDSCTDNVTFVLLVGDFTR